MVNLYLWRHMGCAADRALTVSAYLGLISAMQTLEQTHGKSKLYTKWEINWRNVWTATAEVLNPSNITGCSSKNNFPRMRFKYKFCRCWGGYSFHSVYVQPGAVKLVLSHRCRSLGACNSGAFSEPKNQFHCTRLHRKKMRALLGVQANQWASRWSSYAEAHLQKKQSFYFVYIYHTKLDQAPFPKMLFPVQWMMWKN